MPHDDKTYTLDTEPVNAVIHMEDENVPEEMQDSTVCGEEGNQTNRITGLWEYVTCGECLRFKSSKETVQK